jgi:hypothetical protein
VKNGHTASAGVRSRAARSLELNHHADSTRAVNAPGGPTTVAQLLELLHRGPVAVQALRLKVRDSGLGAENPASVTAALVDGQIRVHWRREPSFAGFDQTRTVQFLRPGRVRVDIVTHGKTIYSAIQNGDVWWRWKDGVASRGSLTQSNAVPRLPPVLRPRLLRPLLQVEGLALEPLGRCTRAGRSAVVVRARPPGGALAAKRGVERLLEFEFDSEWGVVLRRAVVEKGHVVAVTEALEASFDRQFDESVFEIPAPENDGPTAAI